jgi:hypothetical protein
MLIVLLLKSDADGLSVIISDFPGKINGAKSLSGNFVNR